MLLPGFAGSSRNALPARISATHQYMAADHTSLAFYKQSPAQSKGIGHPQKQSHKKHRSAHRTQVVIASLQATPFTGLNNIDWGTQALRTAIVSHPYLFFKEITPPPPKEC